MSKRTTWLSGVAALAAACLLVTLPAHAKLAEGSASTDCGARIQAPAKLISAVVVDEDGNAVRDALPDIQGIDLEVAGLGMLGDGAAVQINDEIARGILRNAGDQPVLLTFANGETVQLEAGQQAAVAVDAECRCKCKCVDGSHSEWFIFACDGNGDDCDYVGDACVWTEGGTVFEGEYTECKKFWLQRTETEPADETTP